MRNIISKFFFTLLALSLGFGQAWATSYIPGDRKVVTADETIDYTTIAGANATTSGKWIVNPRGGTTSGKKYTNLTSDANGNPSGIVDNIATITSNVNMATIQVPSTAKYNQSGKYVIHMRLTGITGIIAHGVTGSSGRGCAIYGQEYSTSLTENTEYGSALASMTRSSNSGSFLLKYTGFTASKEYLITIAATGGDDQLYAIELIAGAATTHSVTYALNGGTGTTPTQADVAEGAKFTLHDGTTGITAPASKEFDGWHDGTTKYAGGAEYTMGTSNVTLTAQWKDAGAASTDATLSALSVAGCTLNETFASADEDYTVDLPFYASMPAVGDVTATKNDAHAADPSVSISGNVITVHCVAEDGTTTKDYTITVTIAAAPTASSSLNFEQNVLDNTKSWDVVAALTTANIVTDGRNGLDSLNDGKTARNYPYLGLKFKKENADIIKIVVPADNVLNVKFGNVGVALTTTVNGVAGANVAKASSGTFHLDAAAYVREVVFHSSANQTVTLQQVKIGADVDAITLPWRVTYDAGDGSKGTCAKASEIWTGTALTLPAVTPVSGWNFDGWNDGANDYNAGDPYTPTTNATLTAQYSAVASGTDLDALTYTIGAGSPVDVGYSAGTFTYNIELPYAVYPTITVAATPVSGASIKNDATKVLTVSSLPGTATFTVTDGVADQLYTVNFSRLPKDGVSIIKATISGGNAIGEVTGLYKKTASCGGLSSGKFNGKGAYIGLELQDGQTFEENDVINIHTTTAAGQGTIALFDDHGNTVSSFHDYGVMGGVGDNKFDLPAAADTKSIIYVCRTEANTWNGYVDFIEVTRVMNPVLTAIQFNSTDVVVTGTTVAATLPNGTNLGTMTVTPTIAWNGAGTAAVTGSWAWGANTYVVTDKDGDATTYTINLTEDVVKHTVTFNTHGGSAVASVEVVEGEKLAAAPADPTKDDYIFQGWAETADGAVVDVTTFTISADKVFHAIWASDGAIKLLDGATVNHTNFITGVTADETVEFMGNTVNYAKFAGTVSGVNGVKDLTRVIAYNATTNKTKIRISAHNNSTSARSILVKGLVEGASAAVDLATIALGNKEDKVSDWIEFDNAANRTIYIMVSSSAGDVYFTQVKVIESGETPMKKAGETGYSLNFNKGRFFGLASTDLAFEGLNARLSGDYTALNSGYAKLTETSMSFTVASAMTLSVTTNNNKTYYVTKGAAGTDNETAKTGVSEFNLTAGTWYITGGTAEVQITNIAFSAPKCAEPSFAALANSDLCEGDAFAALDGTATVADAGVPTYQWYREDDSAIDGATEATYTPAADGSYYVIATNHLAGYADNAKQSATVTVTTHAGTAITGELADQRGNVDDEVTLEVVAGGKNLHYAWKESATIDGTYTDVAGAADAASLNVIITAGMDKYYKVVVTGDCGTPQESTAHVTQFVAVAQANVTGSIAWNWANAASVNEIKLTASTTPKKNEGFVMANGDAAIYNNSNFESDKLYLEGEYIVRDGKYFQGQTIKFNTTVAGAVRVKFSHTGNSKPARELYINGVGTGDTRTNATAAWSRYVEVPAGEVVITAYHVDPADGAGQQYIRVSEIEFFALDVVRDDSWIAPGELGTVCYPNGYVVFGAEMYEMAGTDDNGKFVFDEVTVLTPGKPYMFRATVTYPETIKFYKTLADAASEAGTSNGMIGTFSSIDLDYTDAKAAKWYYFSGTKFWAVSKRTSDLNVPANRCYVDLNTPHPASAPRQDVRRITFDVQGENAATGIDQITNEQSQMTNKVIIDGHLYIIRGEKLYNANGQLVK